MTPPTQQSVSSSALRKAISNAIHLDEHSNVQSLIKRVNLTDSQRIRASSDTATMVQSLRSRGKFGVMSAFLTEYGLTSEEGIALMSLAEALLRVPDAATVDLLIRDKICGADWRRHIGKSDSSLVNLSTRLFGLIAGILNEDDKSGLAATPRRMLQKISTPVIRSAAIQIIRYSANQFVLGTNIQKASGRGEKWMRRGYRYSYDMLGEAAITSRDAERYMNAYRGAIRYLATQCRSDDIRNNPGISVKLSALNPRFQYSQGSLILDALTDSVLELAQLASDANMGLNIDAEEFDKLDLTLDVVERILNEETLNGWEGFGVVVQAYCFHAYPMIEWLHALANRSDRRIMLRLVKGAYWDTEIKHAQVLGVESFPVFTRKCSTDVSFLACAKRALELNDRIYPQFATHNMHSICSILEMAGEENRFEFQRLHGMGEEVHRAARKRFRYPCRIYAPVGAHEDLLAYLVRRILENGANSSFVHQIADSEIPVAEIVADPLETATQLGDSIENPHIDRPPLIFAPTRMNSKGIDLERQDELQSLYENLAKHANTRWQAVPGSMTGLTDEPALEIRNPARLDDVVGTVVETPVRSINEFMEEAQSGFELWRSTPVTIRAKVLEQVADAYEANAHELIALMIRETGKTVSDAVAEVREAVDFCRYYAGEAIRIEDATRSDARGVISCISPWNFPLAIFTGQISAALAAGNSVIAKPAEQSVLTAAAAVRLMYQAGIPEGVVQLLPGRGETVGAALVADKRVDGVCFTGSTETAHRILRTMTSDGNSQAPFIAETGGLNAMIVDSTALPEQAVRDIIASAFQSCGQRCSALRVLYIQKDIESRILEMLFGAMDQLRVGDPWSVSTDVGPAIDSTAQQILLNYCHSMTESGKLLHQTSISHDLDGYFVAPSAFRVSGIEELDGEVFGPILHIATFQSGEIPNIVQSVNDRGYGLTFGLHSRIEQRAEHLSRQINAGNIYINRNQIGAVVGSQPFGGHGLSGTGPKAGGPFYVTRMRHFGNVTVGEPIGSDTDRKDLRSELVRLAEMQTAWGNEPDRKYRLKSALRNRPNLSQLVEKINVNLETTMILDGPTGESNQLHLSAKGVFICIGSMEHVIHALAAGNAVLCVGVSEMAITELAQARLPVESCDVLPDDNTLMHSEHLAGVAVGHCTNDLKKKLRIELASRQGAIVGMITEQNVPWQFSLEKSVCTDTTAAGGNAKLLLESVTG